ncbi:MAG: ammonium transporter [Chitinophagales bacterium]|nr:ammonium transporter [Chitinophagales bacterium]
METTTINELSQGVANSMFTVNNLWMMIATALVFIMHLGFSTLEIGFIRSKNVVNVLFKNLMILPIGIITYYICGFNLMYPGDFNGYLGFAGFGLSMPAGDAGLIAYADGHYTYWTDFLFQAMFAATCATIVSGAVAERIKLTSFIIFSIIFVGLVYPILGSWKWGGGWLNDMGFYDFAGSTLVHSVGGWGALASIILLGPRLGKYGANGSIKPIPGHSMPMAAVGVFMLFLGWFGFNGGSVLSADPELVSYVLVTTTLAACAGGIASVVASKIVFKQYDLSMAFNGILGGLVGITAGADVVSLNASLIIGVVAGLILPFSVMFFDKLKLDDPVGATSVHLVCGIWGTLAVGIFSAEHSFVTQLIGVLAYGVVSFSVAFLLMFILKKTIGIRVSRKEEVEGLDLAEHGLTAYPNFLVTPADGTNL